MNRALRSDVEGGEAGVERLASMLTGQRTLVLSGAGISTESGIPDYRSPRQLARRHEPMMYQEFVSSEEARRRYWARSTVGWPAVARARPNAGHHALAALERQGSVFGVITQNVDGLHQQGGSNTVLELHGALATVVCLGCRRETSRLEFQELLLEANPHFGIAADEVTPDGDAALADELVKGFVVPACDACAGVLKPNVVFFGENVPQERVGYGFRLLDEADALLVVGSSLTVMSGLRFVLAAIRVGIPVAVINDGPTRVDGEADLKLEARLGEALPALTRELGCEPELSSAATERTSA